MTPMTDTKKILIVCTGNTCRSPMAEGLLKHKLAKRGLAQKVEVFSCGTGTRDGIPASSESVFVMRNREIDISGHRSRRLKPEFLKDAVVILAMNESHAEELLKTHPEVKSKLITFSIPDPIGMSIRTYEETVVQIESELEKRWSELEKKIGLL